MPRRIAAPLGPAMRHGVASSAEACAGARFFEVEIEEVGE